MKVCIEIEVNNAAFINNPAELGGMLRRCHQLVKDDVDRFHQDEKVLNKRIPLQDSNGNTVGFVSVEDV